MNANLFRRSALAALLAGTMAVGTMTSVANASVDGRFRVSIGNSQLDFRTTPRWVMVPGTEVYVVRNDMRPNMDFFRFGNRFYVYDHGTWYRANRWNGRYVVVDERRLPPQFRQVPRNHWRAYPNNWRDDRRDWRSNRQDDRQNNRRGGYR